MSKGNMLLGFARGKVGSLVFSRANGKQITRAKSDVVRNPQTTAQMIQRIIMQTAVQAYSKMQPIVDHSFEGLKAGQDSMSFFMKTAINAMKAKLADSGDLNAGTPVFVPLGSNGLAVNAYQIAKGTLPKINPQNVGTGGFDLVDTQNTYADIISVLGLQRGDQLTFCVLEGSDLNTINFKYARVILDPKNGDGSDAALESAFYSGGAVAFANPKNENYGLSIAYVDADSCVHVEPADGGVVAACAVIVSRKDDNNVWKRSDAILTVTEESIGYSMQECLDLFAESSIETVNARYLNNATRQGSVATSTSGGGSQPQPSVPVLTISKSGSGSVTVTAGGSTVASGSAVAAGSSVSVDIVPESGKQAKAIIGSAPVTLTQADGHYTGTFQMPEESSTLTVNTAYDDDPNGDGD